MTDGEHLDDPNRQAVGLEPAWAEGSGGEDTSAGGGPPGAPEAEPEPEAEQQAEPEAKAKPRGRPRKG